MSSANRYTSELFLMVSGRSFMNKTKRSGPKTDPWGIPLITSVQMENIPFTVTLCVRPL